MLFSLSLTAFLLLPTAVLSGQQEQTHARNKATEDIPQQLQSINDSLRQLHTDLEKLSEQLSLQSKVTALSALDTDISVLSSELQRSLEARISLESAAAKWRAIGSSQYLPAVEAAEQATNQEALDQLNRRIDEIRRTHVSRKSQQAPIEKILSDLFKERTK